MLKLSHCNNCSPRSNDEDTTIHVIGKRRILKVCLLWMYPRDFHWTGSQRDFLTGGFGGLGALGLSGGLAVL